MIRNWVIWISIGVFLFVVGAWIVNLILLNGNEERGTFGDMFGSVNALFSGLAFGGIVITILMQRSELQLQREELRETRREFQTQNETLKIQRFENTFFNLLDLHHQIVNAMDFRYQKRITGSKSALAKPQDFETVVLVGRDIFRYSYRTMEGKLTKSFNNFEETYLKSYNDVHTDFGHYFRNLYRIIKLVHEAEILNNFEAKYKYVSIVRSQLSDYELLWLFYNCLSQNGKEKFKPLVELYTLFKNLPQNDLAHKDHIKLYEQRAFIKPKA